MAGFWDGSGISWTIFKQSAPRSRQITTPTPHQSMFTGRMLYLAPNQQCQSTEGNYSMAVQLQSEIKTYKLLEAIGGTYPNALCSWQRQCTLATWHCPHSAADAATVAISQYLLPTKPTAASLQQRVCCYGHWTDGRTLYRFINPAPHTMRAVPIKQE